MARDDLGVVSEENGSGAAPAALIAAIAEVTVEEFRVEEFRCERDTRLGRQVLFLLSSTDWTRRTTALVRISRVRSVDTEVIVDVDLSRAGRRVTPLGRVSRISRSVFAERLRRLQVCFGEVVDGRSLQGRLGVWLPAGNSDSGRFG